MNSNFHSTIKAVLEQVHPDLKISDFGLIQVNKLIIDMLNTLISHEVDYSPLSIQSAVKSIIGGELGKHAISEGAKAVSRYNSQKPENYKITELKINTLSGLQIEIEMVEKIVRSQIKESQMIELTTLIYLGAVLEYLMAEILELGGNVARSSNKVEMTQSHIDKAIKLDKELNQVFINKKPVDVDLTGSTSNTNTNTTKIPIKLKVTNQLTPQDEPNYPHLFEFIKDNINESFMQKWGITDQQIIHKSKELFDDMEQDPTKHADLPLSVLEDIIRKYVPTQVEIEGLGDLSDHLDHLKFLHESAILAYLQDGGKSVKWIDYLDKNNIIFMGLQDYIETPNE